MDLSSSTEGKILGGGWSGISGGSPRSRSQPPLHRAGLQGPGPPPQPDRLQHLGGGLELGPLHGDRGPGVHGQRTDPAEVRVEQLSRARGSDREEQPGRVSDKVPQETPDSLQGGLHPLQ